VLRRIPLLGTGKYSERVLKLNNTDDVLGHLAEFMAVSTTQMGMLGARAMVLGKFHAAALPHLTTLQRVEIARSFRQGIEDALSLMDDVPLPAEYHAALLELTNTILASLS
jgi:hypothetical protein